MSKKIIINLALSLSCSFSQTVQIFADRNKVAEGDVFTLSVEATGSESFAELDVSPIEKDFMIVSGPSQQTSYQWLNGKIMTGTRTLTWTLSPKKDGTLTIPRLSGSIDGKPFTGEPIQILVDNSYQSLVGDSVVFLTTELDKEKAYLGEQINLTYKLYTSINVSIEHFRMPELPGFWKEDYSPKQVHFQDETFKGVEYQVANIGQIALFPLSAEEHFIPQMQVKITSGEGDDLM